MPPRLLSARPQEDLLQYETEVAPVMGMDGTVPLNNMPQGVAVYLYNLLPAEYGCRTRPGYRVWAQNLAGGAVHSIIPFTSEVFGGIDNRMFAATKNGIYDITTQGADNPIPVVTFADQSAEAGFCTFVHHTNAAGLQVLLVADSRNGMYEYNPSGSVWTKYTTEITGADPGKVAFIMIHKERLWLIENEQSDAYYLEIGARIGPATKLQFGSKMKHGGFLVGLYSWSADGGDGVDDYLVAVSKGGDVLLFRGRDPSTADAWDMVGVWFIGRVPENRRIGVEDGGDLLLLSIFGVTSVERLMTGLDPSKVSRNVTAKISRFIGDAIKSKGNLPYWEIKPLREENLMVVNSPKLANQTNIQYALNLNRLGEESGGGWGLMRDLPVTTWESYNAETFFGTETGEVCQFTGALDGVDINGENGVPVEFSGLMRYTNYGDPREKQVQYVEANFITTNVIEINTQAVYDFDITELITAVSGATDLSAKWDISNWDQAIWSGVSTSRRIEGSLGYGRSAAIAIRGSTIDRATLVNVNIAWQVWSFL